MPELLFVYGTLRKARDGSLHPFLRRHAEFMAYAQLPGRLYLIDSYPGAVLRPAAGQVIYGELYRLLHPRPTLAQLDDYEECSASFPEPREYRRERVSLTLVDNSRHKAWAYIYQYATDQLRPLDSGDFSTFLPDTHVKRRSARRIK